jgi:hypothetical protein
MGQGPVTEKYQMESGEDEVSRIKDVHAYYEYCNNNHRLGHAQFVKEKKGIGIYRRVFHFVPLSGPDSIDRRIQQCKTLETDDLGGIKKLHSLVDIGKPGSRACNRSQHHGISLIELGRFLESPGLQLPSV